MNYRHKTQKLGMHTSLSDMSVAFFLDGQRIILVEEQETTT